MTHWQWMQEATAARLDTWWDYGIFLVVESTGNWFIFSGTSVVAKGTTHALGNTWHTLHLAVRGVMIEASVDGVKVTPNNGLLDPNNYVAGYVGLGSGWHAAEYTNFSMTATPAKR